MSSLTQAQPSGFWQTRNPDAPFVAMWYYGKGAQSYAPIGTEYGVVYAPNPYASPGYEFAGWRYIVFEVQECVGVRGERYNGHVELRKRLLTDAEIRHFEGLLAGYRRTA